MRISDERYHWTLSRYCPVAFSGRAECPCQTGQVTSRPRALLVGIDGVRLDRLQDASTPHLDAVASAGFLHSSRIPRVNPTMSGPMWATVLTGVWADAHGVRGNFLPSRQLRRHPDFLSRVTQAQPDAGVFAAVDWPVLGMRTGSGPILSTPAHVIRPANHSETVMVAADAAVAEYAARRLAEPGTVAGFAYLGQVDEYAHRHGTGAGYVAAIERADEQLGRLLAALEARGDRDDWLVMVTTDHGHRDRGGHGRRSVAEETVWIASDRDLGVESLDSAGIAPALLGWLGVASR